MSTVDELIDLKDQAVETCARIVSAHEAGEDLATLVDSCRSVIERQAEMDAEEEAELDAEGSW